MYSKLMKISLLIFLAIILLITIVSLVIRIILLLNFSNSNENITFINLLIIGFCVGYGIVGMFISILGIVIILHDHYSGRFALTSYQGASISRYSILYITYGYPSNIFIDIKD